MKKIVTPLLKWYQEIKRDLPWRVDTDPYHIWISEVMLQQTRVEAVKGYYERFMQKLPTISSIAKMEEDQLLKLWEGLGYYNRARNLQKAAQIIMNEYQGRFPSTYQELLTLPGIGEYTGGAIASISFQEKVPAIDGNVLRVMMRIQNSKENIEESKTKKKLYLKLSKILPPDVSSFNQSLMELGALICIPNGAPKCEQCPVQSFCKAHQYHTEQLLPVKNQKIAKKEENYTILLLRNKDHIAIQKRPATGLLNHLFEFPNLEGHDSIEKIKQRMEEEGFQVKSIHPLPSSKHIFTHKIWNMTGFELLVENTLPRYLWVTKHQLEEQYAIPSAFQKYKNELNKYS